MRRSPFVLFLLLAALAVSSCGSRGSVNLQEKLDSLRTLEELEHLRRQGIDLGDSYGNPLKAFYDSLNHEALPIHYSPDYVEMTGLFSPVPDPIKMLLKLEGQTEARAVSLPQRGSLRPMLVAGYDEGEIAEIWLYTLDRDYFPLDKMCLYDAADNEDEAYFAITSNYEIYRNHVLYHINIEGLILEDLVGNLPDEDEEYFDDDFEDE